ncbi:MAG TPA: hypothetical protein VK524_30980, partial [Polyangiaceae bacterium]|nr:hypothetical protein [Polyangiaceae bacterium]
MQMNEVGKSGVYHDVGATIAAEVPTRRTRSWVLQTAAWLALGLFWVLLTAKLFEGYKLRPPSGVVWGVADDAYITADFARTFAQGYGLRWYPGAPTIEGFSSPLWVVAMAALHWLPGFSERQLGLYVFGLNALILF